MIIAAETNANLNISKFQERTPTINLLWERVISKQKHENPFYLVKNAL